MISARHVLTAAKIGLAVALVAWLATSGRLQFHRLASVPLDARFALFVSLVAGALILPALRWWWLLRIQHCEESLAKVIKLSWAGYFAALLLPGAASGDLAKSYLILRRRSDGRARAFSTILADRFLGLLSLFVLGALAIAATAWRGEAAAATRTMALATLIPLAAMTCGLAALLAPTTRRLLFRILPVAWRDAWNHSFDLYRSGLPQLAGCFGLSLVSSALTIAAFAVAGRLLGEAVPWEAACLAGPLVIVANCLPFTPGGIGLAEATSSELFAHLGSAGGAEMMVLTRICTAVLSLPGLIPMLITTPRSRPDANVDPVTPASPPRATNAHVS